MQTEGLTIDEVAAIFRVSGMTVRRWYASGKFPTPIKDGRNIRWSVESVENWIAAKTPQVNRIKKLIPKKQEQLSI